MAYRFGDIVEGKANTIWVGTALSDEKVIEKLFKHIHKRETREAAEEKRPANVYSRGSNADGTFGIMRHCVAGLTIYDLWNMTDEQVAQYNAYNGTDYKRPTSMEDIGNA